MNPPSTYRPMLHRLAVGLAGLTFPLIWVGGLVTTYEAGMAVDDWPTTYGYNLFLYPWQKWVYGPFDLFVEHGHRLLGAVVGLVTIAVLFFAWKEETRSWVKWFAVGLLLLVIAQGLLGGARVEFDKRLLARIHGCVGPGFFAAAVAFATVTSRRWLQGRTQNREAQVDSRLAIWGIGFVLATYLQLIVGAHLRHLTVDTTATAFRAFVYFHLFLAGVVAILAGRTYSMLPASDFRLSRGLLLALISIQILLGVGAWVAKYSWPDWMQSFGFAARNTVVAQSLLGSIVRTAHVANGSALLGLGAYLALRIGRLVPMSISDLANSTKKLGVAL